uniref:Ras-related protein Rab-10 n=1 Tax=Biomphalaria glabrata TaxID=6526 RepID=A0A2C9L8N2_BIOGL
MPYCYLHCPQHANEDVEKMILGNKCDMDDKRQVPTARGEAIAREHNIPFLETSAKANINVEKAFMNLAQAILNKTPGRVSEPNINIGTQDTSARRCC